MSGESSRIACDVTLTPQLQIELENVIQANTTNMNEEQLRQFIADINKGLTALNQLPTTSRLNELLKAQQSVKNAEVRISQLLDEGKGVVIDRDNARLERNLANLRIKELEDRIPECGHGDLAEKVRSLEQQLAGRAEGDMETDTAQDLADAQAQLEIETALAKEYREQVT